VFFVAAGYANAVVVDKWRASGASYAAFLTLRGSRLLGAMSLFLAVFAAVGTVAAWAGFLPGGVVLLVNMIYYQGGAPIDKGAELAVWLASKESDGITGRLISALWDRWGNLLAAALGPVAEAFRPGALVLGGQIARSLDLFGGPLRERVAAAGGHVVGASDQHPALRGAASLLWGA